MYLLIILYVFYSSNFTESFSFIHLLWNKWIYTIKNIYGLSAENYCNYYFYYIYKVFDCNLNLKTWICLHMTNHVQNHVPIYELNI